jgi:hypothetical protein
LVFEVVAQWDTGWVEMTGEAMADLSASFLGTLMAARLADGTGNARVAKMDGVKVCKVVVV